MKNKRKLLIVFITAILIALLIPILCVLAEENDDYEVNYFESFEDCEEGDDSFGKGEGGEYRVFTDENNNRYLNITYSGGDAQADFPMTKTLRGIICVSLDILQNDLNSQVVLYGVNSQLKETNIATLNTDGSLTLINSGKTIELANPNGPYHIRLIINTTDSKLTVLIDHEVVATDEPITSYGLKTFYVKQELASGQMSAQIRVDNVIIYSGKNVDGKEDLSLVYQDFSKGVRSTMKQAVVMYLNKSNILLHGDPNYISENREIVPFKEGDEIFLPAEFFAQSIGGAYSETDGKATITAGNKTATVDVIQGAGEVSYAEMKALCDAFGKYVHYEDNGLIIYSDHDLEEALNWATNMAFMREMVLRFIYDDVVGSEITALVKENYPNQAHPRLIMTPEKIESLQAAINAPNGDEVYKKTLQSLEYYANRYLNTKPSAYEIRDGIRLLYVCQENEERIMVLAMMYLLTEDEQYAEAAWETMRVCAEFKDWNPYHFLDVGTLAHALGIGYDWLYNWMDDSQREIIRNAIVEKGFSPYMEDLDDLPRKRSWNWRNGTGDNWCMIIAGECVAGLAICDELEGYELECAERAMEASIKDMGVSLRLFAPYGAYEEGPGYWSYGMNYCIQVLQSLITATGSDFGYVDVPGMNLTNQYLMAINGSVSQFNYHDMGRRSVNYPPQTMFLADYFGNYGEGTLRADMILNTPVAAHSALYTVADMYLYNPAFASAELDRSQLNNYLPISEIAVFRTGFDKKDTYVGLHCDDPIGGDSHDHMDVGSFVLNSQGQDFFIDLGNDNYNISNYYKAYRLRAEGHNTVVFNPDKSWDQKYGGTASIVEYFSDEHGGYAIGDLTNAYYEETGVTSFRRGLKLDTDQDVVVLQDEIRVDGTVDMWWFAHTEAFIVLNEEKNRALLTLNGKKLVAEIQNGEGAVFSVMKAEPLPTSPVVPDQAVNEGVNKLAIHIPECGNIDLVVTFVPYSVDAEGFDYEFSSLNGWDGDDTSAPESPDSTTAPGTTDESGAVPPSTGKPISTGILAAIGAGLVIAVGAVLAVIARKKRNKQD